MNRIAIKLIIAIMVISLQSIAQGDLLITPKRVVFEGNKQKEGLNLVNTGKDTAVYSISLIHYKMNEDGTFEAIEKPDSIQKFADNYLRIFPRKVTLAPGEPQVIMLQYTRKPDMLPGEYRSHLYFRAEKNNIPLGQKKSAKDTTLLSVQLIPVYGMSIPVIIRSGLVNVSSQLSDLILETQKDNTQSLRLTINRSGNISVYGDIEIQFIPDQGKPYEIGALKGVGVYTNINKRNVVVKLNSNPGINLQHGKLKVQYISNDETKKPVIYSEAELAIK